MGFLAWLLLAGVGSILFAAFALMSALSLG